MALHEDDQPDSGGVYDDNKPGWRDNPTPAELEKQYNAPAASDEDLPPGHPDRQGSDKKAIDGDDLKAQEEGSAAGAAAGLAGAAGAAGAAASDVIGGGYKGDDSGNRIVAMMRWSQNPGQRRRAIIGGGVGAGIAAFFVSLFLALVPLKIIGIMENIQSHFFATSDSAVSKQTENLFNSYMKKYVMPSLNKNTCPSTKADKSCIKAIPNGTKAQTLYQGWKDARLENKLANDYGIEIQRHANNYTLIVPGEKDTNIGLNFTDDPKNTQKLTDLTTSEVRQRVNDAFSNETKFKQVFYRFKVGRLLERKYAVKRCVVACDARDNFSDWKGRESQAFKVFTANRVLAPLADDQKLIITCFLNGGCEDAASTPDENGGKRDKLQEQMAQQLADYESKYGSQALEDVITESNKLLDTRFSAYVTEKIVSVIASDAAGESAGEAVENGIPIIGWVDGGAKIINTVAGSGSKVKKWAFISGSTAMVQFYQMFRSHADEIKSGHVNADLAGSFTSALNENAALSNPDDPNSAKTGGAAESSPLYQNLFGGDSQSSGKTALLSNFFSGQADAAVPPPDKCDNGNPIPAGQLICPEESLATNNFLTSFAGSFDSPPLSFIKSVAQVEQNTVGKITGFISGISGAALEKIPGFQQASDGIASLANGLLKNIQDKLLPSPFSNNMSGHRSVDMAIGGGDAAASAVGEDGIGGQVLTNGQVADIRNDQMQKDEASFKDRPFLARMFSTDTQYSLVSRVAMAMPSNVNQTVKSSVASLFSNPLSKLSHSLAIVFSPSRVFADAQPADDPFGIPQFGYALNNPVFTTDPETYTDSYCTALNDAWNNATKVDDKTGTDVHTTTNPCLLNDAAVSAAGGAFTTSVLDQGDLDSSPGSTTASGVTGPTGGTMSWPMTPQGSISQCWHDNGNTHPGIDIAGANNTPIFAANSGTVSWAGPASGYGNNFVAIDGDGGFGTSYGHMNSMLVVKGQHVDQGQQIGTEGSQGQSTGPHLHFNYFPGKYSGFDGPNQDPLTHGLTVPAGVGNSHGCPQEK